MDDEHWDGQLENTHSAVCAYARVEIETLARKVIYRLQRTPASGIYGDDYAFQRLWDEYCYEVQEGPHNLPGVLSPEDAWEELLPQFMQAVIERIPKHVAVLLSVYAAFELDDRNNQAADASWPGGVEQVLKGRVSELAGQRGIDHLRA